MGCGWSLVLNQKRIVQYKVISTIPPPLPVLEGLLLSPACCYTQTVTPSPTFSPYRYLLKLTRSIINTEASPSSSLPFITVGGLSMSSKPLVLQHEPCVLGWWTDRVNDEVLHLESDSGAHSQADPQWWVIASAICRGTPSRKPLRTQVMDSSVNEGES